MHDDERKPVADGATATYVYHVSSMHVATHAETILEEAYYFFINRGEYY